MGLNVNAENVFQECLDLNEKYSIDQSRQGVLYSFVLYSCLNVRNYDKCIEVCNTKMKQNIVISQTYLCLAMSYYHKNDIENAQKYVRMAKKSKNDYDLTLVEKI